MKYNFYRRRRGVYGPSTGKKCMLFVDDLSMPLPEKYGAQPPIELLRQWIDHGNWYDLQTKSRIDIMDMVRFIFTLLLLIRYNNHYYVTKK